MPFISCSVARERAGQRASAVGSAGGCGAEGSIHAARAREASCAEEGASQRRASRRETEVPRSPWTRSTVLSSRGTPPMNSPKLLLLPPPRAHIHPCQRFTPPGQRRYCGREAPGCCQEQGVGSEVSAGEEARQRGSTAALRTVEGKALAPEHCGGAVGGRVCRRRLRPEVLDLRTPSLSGGSIPPTDAATTADADADARCESARATARERRTMRPVLMFTGHFSAHIPSAAHLPPPCATALPVSKQTEQGKCNPAPPRNRVALIARPGAGAASCMQERGGRTCRARGSRKACASRRPWRRPLPPTTRPAARARASRRCAASPQMPPCPTAAGPARDRVRTTFAAAALMPRPPARRDARGDAHTRTCTHAHMHRPGAG